MPRQSPKQRVIVFIDGQNFFRSARRAFGIIYPNYDVQSLAQRLCKKHGWQLSGIRFYTGVPSIRDDSHWHHFWKAKLLHMSRRGIHVFSRPLRYRKRQVQLSDGTENEAIVGEEKGIDVRIAVDAIRLAHKNAYDIALIVSQDQDLSEVADEIRVIASEKDRWIKVASAFPYSESTKNRRGINGTDWIRIDRNMYDACLDSRDYRMTK